VPDPAGALPPTHETAPAVIVFGAPDPLAAGDDRPQSQSAGATQPPVTISIGQIEVRAAPAAAQPQTAPAFRPRVSLDDFLARRQGRR
jgi:hypothetical protein